jgi:hypothetical protein
MLTRKNKTIPKNSKENRNGLILLCHAKLTITFYFLYSDILMSGGLLTLEGWPFLGQLITRDSRQFTWRLPLLLGS